MNQLQIIEKNNIRVLTTQQLAESYETDVKVISKNFTRNQDRYQEGKHFILLQGEDLKEFKGNRQIDESLKFAPQLYLWTEKGALLHAKSLGTDKAWEVYDELVETYFRVKKPLSAIEQLQLTQQALLEVKADVDTVNQDLQQFKQDMPLLGLECDRITTAVKIKGVKCLGGKESNAYQDKSLRGRVYSDIYSQLKREFAVGTYKALKRSQTELALSIVNGYKLPLILLEEIKQSNAQMSFI